MTKKIEGNALFCQETEGKEVKGIANYQSIFSTLLIKLLRNIANFKLTMQLRN